MPEDIDQQSDKAPVSGAAASPADAGAAGAGPVPPGEGAAEAAAFPGAPDPRVALLEEENARLREQYLRALADLDNVRRRALRDRDDARTFARFDTLQEMLPAYDALLHGAAALRGVESAAEVAKGVEMVVAQFRAAFGRLGVEEVAPAPGAAFDHEVHEAVGREPAPGVPAEAVSRVIRPGFRAGTRLLRPAGVLLAAGAPAAGGPPQDGAR